MIIFLRLAGCGEKNLIFFWCLAENKKLFRIKKNYLATKLFFCPKGGIFLLKSSPTILEMRGRVPLKIEIIVQKMCFVARIFGPTIKGERVPLHFKIIVWKKEICPKVALFLSL